MELNAKLNSVFGLLKEFLYAINIAPLCVNYTEQMFAFQEKAEYELELFCIQTLDFNAL